MPDELETILRLVAEGTLTPEEAAPIIDALTRVERQDESWGIDERFGRSFARAEEGIGADRGRQLRIRVTERGRQVVNLRIPVGFVDAALRFVPGLAGDQSERIRDAVRAGVSGPIIDVEDPDGDGVLITVE